ncbi:MAG: class I SAM-dependent methyltransferase [Deltaproteobacteria bacterium]|nr:class I SAM-dependent methyltransferase [Deltaproteobacteria bacterium]
MVDIGFGSGDFFRLLVENAKDRRFEMFGLDYSEAAVKRASQIIPDGKFTTGDVYNLPYPSDYFDQVFCIQTLEHLKDPEKVLREFDRVCKKDGVIIITIPNGDLDDYEGHVNFWSEVEFKGTIAPRNLLDFKIYNESRVFLAVMKPLKG